MPNNSPTPRPKRPRRSLTRNLPTPPKCQRLSPPTNSFSENPTTPFFWEIKEFKNTWLNARKNKKQSLDSNLFHFNSRPQIQCVLTFESENVKMANNWSGLILKNLGGNQQVEFDIKMWFKNGEGQEFNTRAAFNHIIDKEGDCCGWEDTREKDVDFFNDLYNKNETLYIYCEITDLGVIAKDEFSQNQWDLYQKGKHDSIVEADGEEFKVFKSFFIAQSKKFEEMFLSAPKKDNISIIKIDGVKKKTMEALIKWLYIKKFDREVSIEELYEVAKKYDIKILKKECAFRLIYTVTEENTFERLIFAVKHNEDELRDFALTDFAASSGLEIGKILTDPKWLEYAKKDIDFYLKVSKLINERMLKAIES